MSASIALEWLFDGGSRGKATRLHGRVKHFRRSFAKSGSGWQFLLAATMAIASPPRT